MQGFKWSTYSESGILFTSQTFLLILLEHYSINKIAYFNSIVYLLNIDVKLNFTMFLESKMMF